MDNTDVVERLRKFVLAHPEMSKSGFIKGLDPQTGKIVIVVNGEDRRITIDELEANTLSRSNDDKIEQLEDPVVPPKSEEIEVMDENIESLNEEVIAPSVTTKTLNTLKDIQDAVLSKDEASFDKALEKFAIDEKTGSISMNKAIKILTENSTNNVISSVKNNTLLPNDLNSYDITGKLITPLISSQDKIDIQNLIDQSFNNILVYVEASKLKNIVYNEAQIANAKNKYSTSIHDKMNVLGLNKKETNVVNIDEYKNQKADEKSLTKGLKPDTNIKKAGFADILILTIIIIIYAAIIVNLVTKLK